jgi:aquaporin Z
MPPPPPDRPLHGAPFPPTRLHPALYAAEFVGTAILVGLGVSVAIAMFGEGSPVPALLPGIGLRYALTGALFGSVAAAVALSPLGRISGAHINPAVTLAFWLEGKLTWRDALLYVLAQFAGGLAGALPLLAWGGIGLSVQFGATVPGVGIPVWEALFGEAGVTFLLLVTLLTMAAHERTRRFTPLSIPVFFGAMVWLEAPVSGTSANPARSFGPAVVAHMAGVAPRDQVMIYLVGPCLGAALAVGLHRLEIAGLRRVPVARLAHFHADP